MTANPKITEKEKIEELKLRIDKLKNLLQSYESSLNSFDLEIESSDSTMIEGAHILFVKRLNSHVESFSLFAMQETEFYQ